MFFVLWYFWGNDPIPACSKFLYLCIGWFSPLTKRHRPISLFACLHHRMCSPSHCCFCLSSPLVIEKCSESDHRHIPCSLYGANVGPAQRRRQRRCREDIGWGASEVTGEPWQQSSLLNEYIEEGGDVVSAQKTGLVCVLQMTNEAEQRCHAVSWQ